jgi:hypothetical protein
MYTLLGFVLILITLIVAALLIGSGAYWMLKHNIVPSGPSFEKWAGLAFNTIILFGWVIKEGRRLWSNRVFWATLGALLAIHLGAFYVILSRIEQLRLFWFFVICTAEWIPISATLEWTMDRFGKHHPKRAAHHEK